MKTLEKINDRIKELLTLPAKELEMTDKQAERELAFMKICRLYLEKNPSEEFVKKQLSDVEHRIELINNQANFKEWLKSNIHRKDVVNKENKMTVYNSEMGLNNLKRQLKTINYLLS